MTLLQPGADDAERLREVIAAAFGHRPQVDPPPPALSETAVSVAAALARGFGVLALVDGVVAGCLIVILDGPHAWITRVSVRPDHQRLGIASMMVEVALELLAERGSATADLIAREEFPKVVGWWRRHGFVLADREGTSLHLSRAIPVLIEAPTADAMQALGRRLAGVVRAGDLVIASGDLGAGKTTLTQGLGAGMAVQGAIISPTFVLARIHPALGEGPGLVHVDAYRLGSFAELEDLDVEVTPDAVTLVEWGAGIADGLSEERLEIDIRRSLDPEDETRLVFLTPIGARWERVRGELEGLARAVEEDS
ncbi:MAG: tRNA (adenosine(37)-N6)-threonylcarbamoyltransferase complex ATPase subunit type 1 TsaE [Propionibacteriaceae bacterium]|nr:tRNA (adenosine(37)-N6)-threonylcarbamoyltransferase complex ATPase subunit type 1 TsaE [Propionibacteriaceae bacterium]